MINHLILLGRVGRKPEGRSYGDDKKLASFSLATSKKINGEYVTTWHNCTAFGKIAEVALEYIDKGDTVYLEGEISITEKDDKQYINVIVNKLRQIKPKKSQESMPASGTSNVKNYQHDKDIPF